MKWRPYLFFLLSLSQGHMKQKNGGRWVATRFGRNLVCHNPMRIGANTKAKKKKNIKKKWHGCVSAALPRQCVSGAGAAAPALHPCFLVAPTTILRNKTFSLSWILIFHGISHKHYSVRKSLSLIKRGLRQGAYWEKREDGIGAY